jgi:hypothetical protein
MKDNIMALILISIIVATLFSSCIGQKKEIYLWIETEEFDDLGGWTVDSQFYAAIGSSYLIAYGLGRPVEDARTRINIPENGTYSLWVRNKNWVPKC